VLVPLSSSLEHAKKTVMRMTTASTKKNLEGILIANLLAIDFRIGLAAKNYTLQAKLSR